MFWGMWHILPAEEQKIYYKKAFRSLNLEPSILCDRNIDLKEKQYVLIPFSTNQKANLTINYKVISGHEINVILMTQNDYLTWERGLGSYLKALSTFESYGSKRQARLNPGSYDLVLDNTGYNTSDAVINLKITIKN